MVDPKLERVTRHLTRRKLLATRERLDALLQEAARKELSYMDFLDLVLSEEAQSKDLKRTRMGIQIAHFPVARRLEDFDFSLQPSIDQKLIRELETGPVHRQRRERASAGAPRRGKDAPGQAQASDHRRTGVSQQEVQFTHRQVRGMSWCDTPFGFHKGKTRERGIRNDRWAIRPTVISVQNEVSWVEHALDETSH